MSKMQVAPADRPRVKAECLRVLATLRLDPARIELISGFVDTYLPLDEAEEQVFVAELNRIESSNQEAVMEIVTSWMERGSLQKAQSLILRQLQRRVGQLPDSLIAQIDALAIEQLDRLAEDLLDFANRSELEAWLAQQTQD